MALQKDTISINMGMGIDQKDDDKASSPNTYRDLKDFVFNKFGRLDKRLGTTRLSTTTDTGVIQASPIKSSVAVHKDQLLLQSNGELYSRYSSGDYWINKGGYLPLEVESKSIVSSDKLIKTPNMGFANGKSIYVYNSYSAVNGVPTWSLRYSVVEQSTGAYIIEDSQITSFSGGLVGSEAFGYMQVISFASKSFIIWQDVATTNIKIVEVNQTTGFLGSISTLISDAFSVASFSSSLFSTNVEGGISHVVCNKSGVGERAFVAYYSSANSVKVVSMLNTGVLDGAMASYSAAVSLQRCVSLVYNETTSLLHLAYGLSSSIDTRTLSFTTSAITLNASFVAMNKTNAVKSIVQVSNPNNPSRVLILWDAYYSVAMSGLSVEFPEISVIEVSSSAVTLAGFTLGSGLYINGQPIVDSSRLTVYLPCQNFSELQCSNFLVDVLKSEHQQQMKIVAKWNYGISNISYSPVIPYVASLGSDKYLTCGELKTRLVNVFGGVAPDANYQLGVSYSLIDISPDKTASSAFLAGTTLMSGGFVSNFDGSSLTENGFFINPEYANMSQSLAGAPYYRANYVVANGGSPSTFANYSLEFYDGSLNLKGPTNYFFFEGFAPTVSGVLRFKTFIYFVIDGVGSAPSVGSPPINFVYYTLPVNINSTDLASEVAQKVYDVLNAYTPMQEFTDFSVNGSIVNINMTKLGVAGESGSNANLLYLVNYKQSYALAPAAGSYQYRFVWIWTDVNGQIIRSAPSVARSFVSNGNPVAITIYQPAVTNKNILDCRCEVYRTAASGTTFFKINDYTSDPVWGLNSRIQILDTYQDSIISSNAVLYTNGGVLNNFQMPAIKHLSLFKNRVVASGLDDTTVFYSKTNVSGSPVEFAEEMFLSLSNDGEKITGHAQLDDKLIVFKERSIIAISGDGANDLGVGLSWSQPQAVATDVGCVNHNSIVLCPFGLIFKSSKGIYLLGRGLDLKYIGETVENYNQYAIVRSVLLKDSNEVRFVLDGSDNSLVYNYHKGLWSVFTNYGGTDAAIWLGKMARVDSSGFVHVETDSQWIDIEGTNQSYSPLIDTVWMKIKGMQDFQRIYRMIVLGDLKTPHTLEFKIYYDYDEVNFDSYQFLSSEIDDGIYQPMIHLKRQKCDSIRIVMQIVPSGGTEESLSLIDMSFQVGMKQGLNKVSKGKRL